MILTEFSFTRYKCTVELDDHRTTHTRTHTIMIHVNIDKKHATPPPHADLQQCKLTQTSSL